jgi:hypothetical protein
MLLKPGEENQEYWFMFSGIDKILHLSIFAALGFLFIAAFPKIRLLLHSDHFALCISYRDPSGRNGIGKVNGNFRYCCRHVGLLNRILFL